MHVAVAELVVFGGRVMKQRAIPCKKNKKCVMKAREKPLTVGHR